MKILILCVGKLKERYLREAVGEYEKRLSAYVKLEIYEAQEEKAPENKSAAEMKIILKKEGDRILSKIAPKDYVVALDLKGGEFSSEEFSGFIDGQMRSAETLVFVVGGSLGLAESVLSRANFRLSFSRMTFPHQLMRVILLEQVYRAFKILRGEPYHK